MFISELTLKNFRNYENFSIVFSPSINFITGENGTGKTNILEAVTVVSSVKSFRNIQDADIIQWGHNSYYCSALLQESGHDRFEVGCSYSSGRTKKRLKIDGAVIQSMSSYFGRMLAVIFAPVDIDIIHGPPLERRRYFDSVISKVDRDYLSTLTEFKKILVSRNRLLKKIRESGRGNDAELEVWDRLFSEKASCIMKKRRDFIADFSPFFTDANRHISGSDDSPGLVYISSMESHGEDDIYRELVSGRRKDIISGSTGLGPQRDDYGFINSENVPFSNYGSQGQKRTAVISLKLAECEAIERETGEKIIILVDDIFSELDFKRRRNMIDILKRGNQVIMTMVNSNTIDIDEFDDIKRFEIVESGVVREM